MCTRRLRVHTHAHARTHPPLHQVALSEDVPAAASKLIALKNEFPKVCARRRRCFEAWC
jgi:hypothetical protein